MSSPTENVSVGVKIHPRKIEILVNFFFFEPFTQRHSDMNEKCFLSVNASVAEVKNAIAIKPK